MAQAPDAFVVTDLDGRVLMLNAAFLDLAQLATEEQAKGQPIGTWIGRPGADLPVFLAMLRKHGSVRLMWRCASWCATRWTSSSDTSSRRRST